MYGGSMPSDNNDINVDQEPDMDYEQLHEQRKFDSDNEEFEIL